MEEVISTFNEFPNNDLTDIIYEDLCYGDIFYDDEFDLDDIQIALELDARPVFLEGVIARLRKLGFACDLSDTSSILTEIKQRYKQHLGISCPRTVQEWIKGTTPSVTERKNNYDLCYALEMNLHETAEFFLKHYLTLPFNYKDTTDAIYFYCLYHQHPYSVVTQLLDVAATFKTQDTSNTDTLQIGRHIITIANNEEFLEYLAHHCFSNEQQYNEYCQCTGAPEFSMIGRARCCRRLSEIYYKYGKVEKAEQEFKLAKEKYIDCLGENHPEVQEFLLQSPIK